MNVVTESIDQSQPIAVTGQETLTREGEAETVNRLTDERSDVGDGGREIFS